jgi:uncharacterized protein
MGWIVLEKRNFKQLVEFLLLSEESCVSFTSRLLKGGKLTYPSKNRARIYIHRKRNGGAIQGAILHTAGGNLVSAIPTESLVNGNLSGDLNRFMGSPFFSVQSIMGMTSGVRFIENSISKNPSQEVDYYLMYRNSDKPACAAAPRISGIECNVASSVDTENLLPLQIGYEIEEVLLDKNQFSKTATYTHLQKSLKRQYVLAASINNKPIAKAGTNARGINYDQLGGVYTDKRHRNLGVGSYIMDKLITHLLNQKKYTTLFVKNHNKAAISLYTKLGYKTKGDFRIAYFY